MLMELSSESFWQVHVKPMLNLLNQPEEFTEGEW